MISRRRVLTGGVVLAVGGIVTGRAAADSSVIGQLAALENEHDVLIGLFAVDLDSNRTVANRAEESFAMCSTFKVYAVGRVLQQVTAGELTLDRPLFVDPAHVVDNSPITGPRAGTSMPLGELCRAALQHSDNTAANLLLATLGGPAAVTAFARSIGDDRTRLDRWETELNTALPGDPRDSSTPTALASGFRALLTGDVLPAPQRQQLKDWMLGNQTSSMRAGLPPGWTSADKTGSGDFGSTNDVGLAIGPNGQRVLLAIMIRSRSADPDAAGQRPLVGQVAASVLAGLLGQS